MKDSRIGAGPNPGRMAVDNWSFVLFLTWKSSRLIRHSSLEDARMVQPQSPIVRTQAIHPLYWLSLLLCPTLSQKAGLTVGPRKQTLEMEKLELVRW